MKYAPKVVVLLEDGALDTGRIPEGNTVKFWCNADANPQDITYRWFMNDEVIVEATLNQLVSGNSLSMHTAAADDNNNSNNNNK